MLWKQTNGWSLADLGVSLSISDDYTLGTEEKAPFLSFACSAASKSIVLGVAPGECMVVANIGGSNAVTVKAITGDSGSSVAAGKVALVIGAAAANASKIYVLN